MAPPPSTQSQPSDAKPAATWQPLLLVALVTAIVTGAAAILLNRPNPEPIVVHPPPTLSSTTTPEPTQTPAPIVVFVSGAIATPGLYELPPDSRAASAVTAAGGFTDDADVNVVNQAELLYDGAQVHIPKVDEPAAEPPIGVSGEKRSGSIELSQPGIIHLNSATLAELETLPGIGQTKAQAIIDGRPYDSIEELDDVPGIGPSILKQTRDLVDLE